MSTVISTPSEITAWRSGTNKSVYTTFAFTPTANSLVFAEVVSQRESSGEPNEATVSGHGVTWSKLTQSWFDTTSNGAKVAASYATFGASPSSDTIAFSFGGQNQERAAWIVVEVAARYHITDPIIQVSTATNDSSKLSAVLPTEPLASGRNATLGIAGWDATSSESYFNGAGWTLISAQQDFVAERIAVQWNPESARTSNATLDVGSTEWGMIVAEIRAESIRRRPVIVVGQAINRASYW